MQKVDPIQIMLSDIFNKVFYRLASNVKKCPDCDGDGEVEIEVPRPHNVNRDIGVLDAKRFNAKRAMAMEKWRSKMSKRIHELPVGSTYIVLPNGAAAQLNYMDVNTLQVALDHLQEHLNDLDVSRDPREKEMHQMELDSTEFLKELFGSVVTPPKREMMK